jgi:hypothetical protein
VKTWFQGFAFKWVNVCRSTEALDNPEYAAFATSLMISGSYEVGCISVDP